MIKVYYLMILFVLQSYHTFSGWGGGGLEFGGGKLEIDGGERIEGVETGRLEEKTNKNEEYFSKNKHSENFCW